MFRGLGEEVLTQISRMVFTVKVLSGEKGCRGFTGVHLNPRASFIQAHIEYS